MTPFKILTSDLTRLSRFRFAHKYVFPFIAAFLTWGALGNLYILSLSQKDLIANKGEVKMIKENKIHFSLSVCVLRCTKKFHHGSKLSLRVFADLLMLI